MVIGDSEDDDHYHPSHPEETVVIPGVNVEPKVKEGGAGVSQNVCKSLLLRLLLIMRMRTILIRIFCKVIFFNKIKLQTRRLVGLNSLEA